MRLDCADEAEAACDEVAERLEDAGVKVGGRAGVASAGGEGLLRVKVGVWTEVRKDPAVRELEKGPVASGVFARPAEDGRAIELLDPAGEPAGSLGPGSGLVAATRLSRRGADLDRDRDGPRRRRRRGGAAPGERAARAASRSRCATACRSRCRSQDEPVTP